MENYHWEGRLLEQKDFIILVGPTGAGKSTVLSYLQDLNFFCVDDIPSRILYDFARFCRNSKRKRCAVVINNQQDEFFNNIRTEAKVISELSYNTRIIFINAPPEILVRRFSVSYRIHPLIEEKKTLLEAVKSEINKMEELKALSDLVIETGDKTFIQLREETFRIFSDEKNRHPMTVTLMSFGYKYGIPEDADLIFDTRILSNPFYEPQLKFLDGRHPKIHDFLFKQEEGQKFLDKIQNLLRFMIPLYVRQGKFHLTIAVGCTGGKHRSVAVVDKLYENLKDESWTIFKSHREIGR